LLVTAFFLLPYNNIYQQICDGIQVSGNRAIHKVTQVLLILTTELLSCHTPNLEVAAGVLQSLWTLARHCNRFHIV